MRKIVQMLVVLCMVLMSTQVVFANADKVTIAEGADITTVHRMAVAAPLYTPIKGAPGKDAVTKLVYDASSVARGYVISYDMVAQNIQKDKNIDILHLDRRQASQAFKDNVASYADAYVVMTVANNSRTVFFFDVYKAGTNELLYTYEIAANRSDPDTVAAYTTLVQQFYKNFDRSAEAQQKDHEKAANSKHK